MKNRRCDSLHGRYPILLDVLGLLKRTGSPSIDGDPGLSASVDDQRTVYRSSGDQTLFAPAFTTPDDDLAEMVSRFAASVSRVAEEVGSELPASAPVGGAS